MKKKKILLFTISSVTASMFIVTNCYAANKAYSVGSKWPTGTYGAGSDFTTNVKNASNAYGWLDGYTSYYNTEPTYSYMKGSRLGSSQAYFINGHASATHIDVVSKDESNYRTGITISGDGNGICDSSGDEWIFAGLDGRNMSGTKLITFAGCQTGKGTNNLVTKAVSQGAKTAVGFKENVTSRYVDGPKWLKKYNNLLGNGNTVKKAISGAVTAYPNWDLSTYVTSSGNTSTKLGILATTSSNYIKNLNVSTAEERDLLKPIEETYAVLGVDSTINIELNKASGVIKTNDSMSGLNSALKNVIEVIKKYDSTFNLNEYKMSYNLVNESEGYGYIFFTYYIDNTIETNKVYLVEIMNNRVENIILAGVKEANIINISNDITNTLIKRVTNFAVKEKEKAVISENSNIFNTQNILTEENCIDETKLNENIKEYSEKYYYDYNTKELSYMLTTYIETANQTVDGEIIKVVIE